MRMPRRSSACGWPGRSSACGWPGRSSACGWPGRSSACGWPGRSSADGDSSSRMVNVAKWVRSGSALAGGRPLGRLLDPGLVVVPFFFRTTHDVGHHAHFSTPPKKKDVRRRGTVGGCARVHERIVWIGLRRRQNGKSKVPAKQRGSWPKLCSN